MLLKLRGQNYESPLKEEACEKKLQNHFSGFFILLCHWKEGLTILYDRRVLGNVLHPQHGLLEEGFMTVAHFYLF